MEPSPLMIASQVTSIATAIIGSAWFLSSRLQRLSSTMVERLGVIDRDLQEIRRELETARASRKDLWYEVNSLRERTAATETKIATP